ncbi:hypothetical protein Tco_0597826 [Tanacetum coccineum]
MLTAPENAIGSPSTTVISEGAPAVTESLLPHQIPLPDTSDSDIETLFDNVDSNVFDTYTVPETNSEASSSNTINIDVTPKQPIYLSCKKWTQLHSLDNIIGDKDSTSTRAGFEAYAWKKFMSVERLDVWILVNCPVISYHSAQGIFIIKLDEYGERLKNKSRVVGKDIVRKLNSQIMVSSRGRENRLPSTGANAISVSFKVQRIYKGVVDPTLFTRKAGKHIRNWVYDTSEIVTSGLSSIILGHRLVSWSSIKAEKSTAFHLQSKGRPVADSIAEKDRHDPKPI